MTADQSIIDSIVNLRKVSLSTGQGSIAGDDAPETDLDGLKTMNLYLAKITTAFGGSPTGNTGIVDNLTAVAAMAQNIGKIVKCLV